jgi:hypothetical protein
VKSWIAAAAMDQRNGLGAGPGRPLVQQRGSSLTTSSVFLGSMSTLSYRLCKKVDL